MPPVRKKTSHCINSSKNPQGIEASSLPSTSNTRASETQGASKESAQPIPLAKRKRGRPRKEDTTGASSLPQDSIIMTLEPQGASGESSQLTPLTKQKRGRPRKEDTTGASSLPQDSNIRTPEPQRASRESAQLIPSVKRTPGRPRKKGASQKSAQISAGKRGRGRPKRDQIIKTPEEHPGGERDVVFMEAIGDFVQKPPTPKLEDDFEEEYLEEHLEEHLEEEQDQDQDEVTELQVPEERCIVLGDSPEPPATPEPIPAPSEIKTEAIQSTSVWVPRDELYHATEEVIMMGIRIHTTNAPEPGVAGNPEEATVPFKERPKYFSGFRPKILCVEEEEEV